MADHMPSHTPAAAPHHPSMGLLLGIYAVLMGLLVVTVVAAEIDLGPWNFIVATGIAMTKAVLILLVFMHLRYSSQLLWVVAASGFLFLALLIAGTLNDYLSRSWLT